MTIKDIAEKCGVSVSTVSRVLNQHPYVNPEIREKVLRVIEEEHFVPHTGAVGLVKAKSDAIGVLVRGISNPFFKEIIPILETSIVGSGYSFLKREIHSDADEIMAAVAFAKDKSLKGIIFLGGRFDWTSEQKDILEVPYVCCTFSNRFGDVEGKAISSVGIDDSIEAYRAVKKLIDRGHRDIAILLPAVEDHSVGQLRFEGYAQALVDSGIEVNERLIRMAGAFDMQSAYRETIELVKSGEHFTAVFAVSDTMAIAAMKALSDMGVSVPDQCSVIAIDGLDISRYMIPTLTTMEQPVEELATNAVEIMKKMLDGKSTAMQVTVGASFREGGSIKKVTN